MTREEVSKRTALLGKAGDLVRTMQRSHQLALELAAQLRDDPELGEEFGRLQVVVESEEAGNLHLPMSREVERGWLILTDRLSDDVIARQD